MAIHHLTSLRGADVPRHGVQDSSGPESVFVLQSVLLIVEWCRNPS